MKPLSLVCCLAFVCAGGVIAGPIPDLVYSSFAYYPPGPIGPLPDVGAGGQAITGAALPPGYVGYALSFVPSNSFEIEFMDFGLNYLGGTNSAIIELRDDFYGMPGPTLLDSWTASGVTGGLLGVPVSGRVEAGQRYWIAVLPGASDTILGWTFNNQGVTGELRVTHNGMTYPDVCQSCTLPEFDLLGTAVPEPSALLLVLAGCSVTLAPAILRHVRCAAGKR